MAKPPCDPNAEPTWPIYPFTVPVRVELPPPRQRGGQPGQDHLKILDYVQTPAHPSITTAEACALLGRVDNKENRKRMNRLLETLMTKGVVIRIDCGTYQLAPHLHR